MSLFGYTIAPLSVSTPGNATTWKDFAPLDALKHLHDFLLSATKAD